MKKVTVLIIMAVCMMQFALAEKGTIRGKIVDGENGEELIGVNVVIEGTTIGTASDIDGSFAFRVEEGEYSIVFSYISYLSKSVEQVKVVANKVTNLDLITMDPEGMGLDEVVVTARALTNTENSLLMIQKKSSNVIDGISAQTFSKTGDGNAAAAIRRVTGVTVEGGKYVYVRGLGDRYSKSILNGLEIPGLDPERNSVQMDIFPTNIIDNIVVYKSFTPDLPGDFTGGMVDVTTKEFPSDLTLEVSASFGYDNITHFNDDFILYEGSNKDAIGFGSRDRELPFPTSYEPDRRNPDLLFSNTNALNKEIEAVEASNFIDQSYSISFGNQVNSAKATIGYLGALNYSNSFTFQPDFEQNEVQLLPQVLIEDGVGIDIPLEGEEVIIESKYPIDRQVLRNGKVGIQEALWSAVMSTSVKWKKSKLGLKVLHTQASEKSASRRTVDNRFDNIPSIENSLDYIQRSVSNVMLNGEHYVANDRLKLTWANAVTKNGLKNPDQTNSNFVVRGEELLFNPGSSNLLKLSRELNEFNNSFKTDLEYKLQQWSGLDTKLKFGTSHIYKQRDFSTSVISIGSSNNFNPDLVDVSEGINTILQTENLFSSQNEMGYLIDGVQIDKENQYMASMHTFGNYIMTELPLHKRLKFIGGVRAELAIMNYQGNERLSGRPIDKKVLNSLQLLPSANFIYSILDDLNLRANYSRTLARPSFREKSESIIYDPVSTNTFYGNLDLVETTVHNADLRLEYFFGVGEMISLSGFYKNFSNPIEIQPLENSGVNNIQPVNRPSADVTGVEVEMRKNFSFIHESLRNLTLAVNFTYVKSNIALSEEQKDKYIILEQPIPDNRAMLGQSPFVFNAGLSYANTSAGTEINLSYNVKGKTLILAGIGTIPDVYEDPFHGLDFKMSQKLGKTDQFKISASVRNIIGDNFNQYYEYLGEELETFRSFSRGRQVSLGFAYSL